MSKPNNSELTIVHPTLWELPPSTIPFATGQCDACSPIASMTGTPTLATWLHLTDSCNLRCHYCYLPHASHHMSTETGYAAVQATVRSALAHNYQQIKLKYAGGEPLLHVPLIVELQRYAQHLAAEHGLALDGVVLSNGTLLTPGIIVQLKALNLRLMISLDGLGAMHDQQRPYLSGHGSANDALRAVELALAHDLVPDISITVTGRNAPGLPMLIAWVLERDLPFSLNFYRENDYSASQTDLQLEEETIITGMLTAYRVIERNLPRRSLLASLVDRANLAIPHHYPCSVGQNYLVVDPQGRVARCQMALNEVVTTVYDLDPLALVRASEHGFQNVPVDTKEGCHSCEWRYWCAGGCPLLAYRTWGRSDVPSPNCTIYKALYPEVVKLEGMRLMAAHEQLI